ncbi:Scr1 family TA system antitoxin-like transcriptional regulator [Streptomyces sp. NPDC101225]|uniref:helix-turn-helix domain-containing protein n=1 Tax=Streptomyces sp. NPDC101225 TaxID=3366135 RepID=UPI00380B2DD7
MPVFQDPALNRRKLRDALRDARIKASMTQPQAADALEWSRSKIIRIEGGLVSLSVTDLRAMLQLYNVTDVAVVSALEEAARNSKGNSWWTEFNDIIKPPFAQLLSYEAAASTIRMYHPVVVPGQLETYDYAVALLSAQVSEEEARHNADLRMKRYERIIETDLGPEVLAVVDETALLRQIGTPAVMRNQLRHLRKLVDHPRVDLRILPLDAGAHYSTLFSFLLLSFEGSENDLLYQESAFGGTASSDEVEYIAHYQECFEEISSRSLKEADAQEAIDKAMERLSQD